MGQQQLNMIDENGQLYDINNGNYQNLSQDDPSQLMSNSIEIGDTMILEQHKLQNNISSTRKPAVKSPLVDLGRNSKSSSPLPQKNQNPNQPNAENIPRNNSQKLEIEQQSNQNQSILVNNTDEGQQHSDGFILGTLSNPLASMAKTQQQNMTKAVSYNQLPNNYSSSIRASIAAQNSTKTRNMRSSSSFGVENNNDGRNRGENLYPTQSSQGRKSADSLKQQQQQQQYNDENYNNREASNSPGLSEQQGQCSVQ